ncbi:MAG: ribosome assembly RNA-binding protein YhbY [Proteobacteria bacterium]|nr:MAG: ribosome assembly RNA-binding protein YhbY [Pseudomonadota bacterium]PCI45739.1 MAG: ribosome assembly RNA-binding protein YhbY [Pseudomonadota bacterium]
MPINSKQRKALKTRAHHLKPVIRIGQHGVSEGVIAETHIALNTHELIKVQIQQGERDDRHTAIETLCQQTQAELIHSIGKVFIIYRQRKEQTKK